MMKLHAAIVEDEILIAEDLARMIRALGHEVVAIYTSPHEAIHNIPRSDANVVFLDIQLSSDIDGIAVAEKLNESARMPVIFITGYSDEATMYRATSVVPYGYIVKPFHEHTIRITVQVAIALIEAEKKIEQSEKRYKTLFETMPAMYALNKLIIGDTGEVIGYKMLECNTAMKELLKYRNVDSSGYLEDFFPDDHFNWFDICKRIHDEYGVEKIELYSPVFDAWFAVILFIPFPEECGLLMHDITPIKKLEIELSKSNEALQNLMEYQQNLIEIERKSIAQNIHDTIGQYLTAITMDVAFLMKSIGNMEPMQIESVLAKTKTLVSDAITSVREFCVHMRSDVLENLGLKAAIEWYLRERLERTNIAFEAVMSSELPEITKEIQLAYFRIFQEGITNVIRHAGASRVCVKLEMREDDLVMEIIDDGIGVTNEQIIETHSLGLLGMKERARMCNGELEIENNSGGGTILRVSAPMK
jgi:signal transduction histidine kinase